MFLRMGCEISCGPTADRTPLIGVFVQVKLVSWSLRRSSGRPPRPAGQRFESMLAVGAKFAAVVVDVLLHDPRTNPR